MTDGDAPSWARDISKLQDGDAADTVEVEITIEIASENAAALQSAFDVGAPVETDISTSGVRIANGRVVSVASDTGESCKTGYDKRGNKIPLPSDTCEVCGVQREERPDGFAPEITVPFGEVEYLCGRCRERGRGLK